MEFLNDRKIVAEIANELGIDVRLVENSISSFHYHVAKEIENSNDEIDNGIEKVIEIKHFGKFKTKTGTRNGKLRTDRV